MFEHFGSLKSAVHSAGDGRPGDSLLDVEGGDKRMAVDPQYTIPKVQHEDLTSAWLCSCSTPFQNCVPLRVGGMAADLEYTRRSNFGLSLIVSNVLKSII